MAFCQMLPLIIFSITMSQTPVMTIPHALPTHSAVLFSEPVMSCFDDGEYVRPWAHLHPPPPPPVDHIFFKPYYLACYFQVICIFSMYGQGHQRSSKYGTL